MLSLTRALIFKSDNALFSFANDLQYSLPCPFVYIPFISPEINFADINSISNTSKRVSIVIKCQWNQ